MPRGGFQSVIIAAHVHDTLSTRRACGAQMSSSNLHRKTPQGAHPPDGEVTVQTGQVTAQGGTAVWEPRCLPLPSRRKSSPLLRDTVLVSHRPAGGPSSQSPVVTLTRALPSGMPTPGAPLARACGRLRTQASSDWAGDCF